MGDSRLYSSKCCTICNACKLLNFEPSFSAIIFLNVNEQKIVPNRKQLILSLKAATEVPYMVYVHTHY